MVLPTAWPTCGAPFAVGGPSVKRKTAIRIADGEPSGSAYAFPVLAHLGLHVGHRAGSGRRDRVRRATHGPRARPFVPLTMRKAMGRNPIHRLSHGGGKDRDS